MATKSNSDDGFSIVFGGVDTFLISKHYGPETIDDFKAGAGGDVLRLRNLGFATFASVIANARQVGANTVINLPGGKTLTLLNVQLSSLTAANVVLDRSSWASDGRGVAHDENAFATAASKDSRFSDADAASGDNETDKRFVRPLVVGSSGSAPDVQSLHDMDAATGIPAGEPNLGGQVTTSPDAPTASTGVNPASDASALSAASTTPSVVTPVSTAAKSTSPVSSGAVASSAESVAAVPVAAVVTTTTASTADTATASAVSAATTVATADVTATKTVSSATSSSGTSSDLLTVGATNDLLQALGSNVTLVGVTGNNDTGYSLANAPTVQNLALIGNSDAYIIGNALNNILIGNAGNNLIDGGLGNDTMTGGGGVDTFEIAPGDGNDTITDFTTGVGGDVLQLDGFGFTTLSDVTSRMTQVGSNVVLELGSNQSVTFDQATVQSFVGANVDFVSSPSNDLTETFNDDFTTLSAGQNPALTWRTSYEWGGAAEYMPSAAEGSQEINVDPSFTGLPGAQASSPLGINPFTLQSGGGVAISAEPVTAADAPYVGGAQFTTGMLTSENSFAQTYGYFQMTATLPATTSAWPAFWLLPENGQTPDEIDIMEDIGQNVVQSHWAVHSEESGVTDGAFVDTANLSVGKHTFAAEWTPYSITYFVDGIETAQVATPYDANTPMYMLATLGMGGGSWVGQAAAGSSATMTVYSISAYQLPQYTLANFSLLSSATPTTTISGSVGETTLTGDSGDDLISDANGATTLIGGSGDDTFVVSRSNTQVEVGYADGVDTIESSVSYTLPNNVNNLILTGNANLDATGNMGADTIVGNAGSDVITAGSGEDILSGGAGSADTFVINVGFNSDIITDFIAGSAAGHDVVDLNGSPFTSFSDITAAMSQVGADVYLQLNSWATLVFRNETVASFTSADFQLPATFPVSAAPTGWEIATGNNQTLYGSGVNDQMQDQGYSGVTLVGGKGDDTYVVANSGTTIVELPNQGVDTVEAWASYTLPANVEDLTLEQGGLTGTGNSQANYIIASSTGNNTINGGGGDDMIAAGGGDDTFVFNTTPNTLTNDVTITTFSVANDVFSLSRSVYGALSQGALSSSDFSIGSGATSASDHIIYNSATGALMYDADGSGSGAAVQFAKLSAGLALTASNFSVTA